uniref:Peptidase M48 domain-containing protein n=1 Tax=Aegilops tauschii subsp. strangulata TaxID=200361 RepID=A0A453A777_AEGTS
AFKQYASWILEENDDRNVRVNRIVMELAGGVHRSLANKALDRVAVGELNWEAVVLRHDSVNAYVLYTGKIVVFTRLLRRLHTDAEIAAVLGHEFGHVLAKHTSEMIANLIDTSDFRPSSPPHSYEGRR